MFWQNKKNFDFSSLIFNSRNTLAASLNGFGTQAAWPDGTGFSASDFGDVSKGGTSIRDLCQGMSNCVGKIKLKLDF